MAHQTSNTSNKILYGDDDPDMQMLIKIMLQRAGMEVVVAGNGQEVLNLWRRDNFDGVVLDVMMPVIDGLEICRRIRRLSQVPILLLTARGQEEEVVQGLEAGADDYIVKPVRQKEFLARLKVALKRAEKMREQEVEAIRCQDMVILPQRRTVTVRGQMIHLTPLEYQILLYFANKKGAIVSKRELFENVWGYGSGMAPEYVDLNIVEAAILRLRRKLQDDPTNPRLIETIRGIGYQLKPT